MNPQSARGLEIRRQFHLAQWKRGVRADNPAMVANYQRFFKNPHLKGQYGSNRKRK